MAKVADDTKLDEVAGGGEEAGGLQKGLEKLGEWEMEYSIEKCTAMHFPVRNENRDFFLNGERGFKIESC